MPLPDEIRELVNSAVHEERLLLAQETGSKPYGAGFAELLAKVTHAIEHALEVGDNSFKNVQGLIDRQRALANNPRRKPKYDIENAARNISRLRRSAPKPGLGSGILE